MPISDLPKHAQMGAHFFAKRVRRLGQPPTAAEQEEIEKLDIVRKGASFLTKFGCAFCLDALVESAYRQTFDTGTAIKVQGEPCDGLYILTAGFAREVLQPQAGGTELTIRLIKPGEAYGLMPLLDKRGSATSLVTMQPCEFLVIAAEHFTATLKAHSNIYPLALDQLCTEMRQAHEWLASLS